MLGRVLEDRSLRDWAHTRADAGEPCPWTVPEIEGLAIEIVLASADADELLARIVEYAARLTLAESVEEMWGELVPARGLELDSLLERLAALPGRPVSTSSRPSSCDVTTYALAPRTRSTRWMSSVTFMSAPVSCPPASI